MSKTATIYSREEVAAMPQSERPLNYRITEKMYMGVFAAIGEAASFDSGDHEQLSRIATDLCLKIADETEGSHGPLLDPSKASLC